VARLVETTLEMLAPRSCRLRQQCCGTVATAQSNRLTADSQTLQTTSAAPVILPATILDNHQHHLQLSPQLDLAHMGHFLGVTSAAIT